MSGTDSEEGLGAGGGERKFACKSALKFSLLVLLLFGLLAPAQRGTKLLLVPVPSPRAFANASWVANVTWAWTVPSQPASFAFPEGPPSRTLGLLRLARGGSTLNISRECVKRSLGGRRIVFMGDSVTRYQFLNLAYWWRTGLWASSPPELENEKHWASWPVYYATATNMLSGDGMCTMCDCFRLQDPLLISLKSTETIHIYDAVANVTLIYVQLWGLNNVVGHNLSWLKPPNGCAQVGCVAGLCDSDVEPWHFSLRPPRLALEGIAERLRPDTMIINSGLWDSYTDDVNLRALLQGGEGARRHGVAELWWKTTTPRVWFNPNNIADEFRGLVPALLSAGWGIIDIFSPVMQLLLDMGKFNLKSTDLYWDNLHFEQIVNRGFNELLLAELAAKCVDAT